MTYVDGFVAPVPDANKEEFIKHARIAAEVFKRHGALKVVETWGDDVPEGKVTSLPMAVKCKEGESVVFSWVVWPSKEVREKGMAALMEDPDMSEEANPMPFDASRLIYGGFEVVLEV